jgi:NAD(P)H-hydrate epimerase
MKSFILTPLQMRKADERAIKVFGIPSLILMENAGRAVAERVAAFLKWIRGRRVLIVCGTGNNGGDGFVVARHLMNQGHSVKIILLGRLLQLTPDAKINFKIAKKMGIPTQIIHPHPIPLPSRERDIFLDTTRKADLIIDAIFGTGLSRPVAGKLADAIREINQSQKPVIAIDIPSGLDGETGEIMGVTVRAKETVALGAPKTGFYLKDGPKVCGRVTVADISIPRNLLKGKGVRC